MASLPRPLRIARQALGTMASHPVIVLALCVGIAALRTPLDYLLYGQVVGFGKSLGSSQGVMIQYILMDAGLLLLAEIILGPILAAVAVYLARRDQVSKDSSLGAALLFARRRYGALFLPHLAAQISIQVGLQLLIVPGLLFYGMYGFVEPVACLEEDEWPLDRSKALTRGRRGTIMWLVIPIITLLVTKTYVVDLQVLEQGLVAMLINDVFNLLMEFFLYAAFAWLYLERVTPAAGAAPAPAPQPADG